MKRLSAEDLSILELENETVAGHTCKVIVLGGQIDAELLRASIASRLSRAPQLCMRLSEVAGAPAWVLDPHLDMSEHVVLYETAEPPDETALRAIVARIFEQRLDRSQPLWRIDVIPQLAGGGSALIWRIHHALADGSTTMRLAKAALWDDELNTASGPSESPERSPQQSIPGAHHRLGGLRAAAREAPKPWLRSPFSGHIGARRSVAFTSVELEGLRRVTAANHGATVNDAVLSVVAGGLRRWLEARAGHLGVVRVKVPVSLHGVSGTPGGDGVEPGNRDSFFCLDLPLGTSDPLDRLAAIRRATKVRKQGHDAEHLDSLMRQLGHIPPLRHFAERALAHPRSFALNISNVPGPRESVHVLGIPVRALYPLAELRERHGLRIAVASLAGRLNFGLAADSSLLADVDYLADGIQAEAAALTGRFQPPPE